MITLYSTGCPQCKILEKKLDMNNYKYDKIEDEDIMIAKGFESAPMLEVDGLTMNFNEAIKWIKIKENN